MILMHVVKHTHSSIFVYTLINIFTDRLSPVSFARIYSNIPGLRETKYLFISYKYVRKCNV